MYEYCSPVSVDVLKHTAINIIMLYFSYVFLVQGGLFLGTDFDYEVT